MLHRAVKQDVIKMFDGHGNVVNKQLLCIEYEVFVDILFHFTRVPHTLSLALITVIFFVFQDGTRGAGSTGPQNVDHPPIAETL